MFCDMEGFTPLVEKLGPEESYALMDRVYEILIQKVHDYEGTVNEMTGDGIMALFGAPITLEDAPQRAIRSAIAIHGEMARLGETLWKDWKEISPPQMRIGIHTGHVVVGTLGNDLRVEFKAVGDTVNLASRMEGLAEPGSTCVTEETFRMTEGLFHFEALGRREIKGKKELVGVYRVIAPGALRTRFEVRVERGLTPFVGRERELGILLDGFEMVKSGKGQAFSIVAGPGLGKSRLMYEFRRALANEGVTFWEGRCFSYTKDMAYHPFVEVLRCCFDIGDGDEDEEIRQKVKKGISSLGADEPATLPHILGILSVMGSDGNGLLMSPEARQYRMIGALSQIFVAESQIHPLVVTIEDIHWIDKVSEAALKYLVDAVSGSRVLLVVTYRTGYIPPWSGKSHYHQVNLNRLSDREGLMIALHLMETERLDQDLKILFLQKSEGVPFFMEELISSLKQLKCLEKKGNKCCLARDAQDMSVPSTINEVIMARVDALPDDAKELLQTCAVIEREFSYKLLEAVTDTSQTDLLPQLAVLNSSELLYEKGLYPHSAYIFRHALTRDVVYDSILDKKRKRIHEKIGKTMEELYKDDLEEQSGVLAEHFIACDDYRKGAEYADIARESAMNSASYAVASAHARKRVTCLERLPDTEEVQNEVIDARTVLARCLFAIGNFHDAQEAIDSIVDQAEKGERKGSLSHIYTVLGGYYFMVVEDSAKAIEYLERASDISHEVQNFPASFFADYFLGLALCWNCEFERGLGYIEKVLDLSVGVDNSWGISVMKSQLSLYGYHYQGRVKEGYQASSEALRMAEEIGDLHSRSMAYVAHGSSCFFKGDFKDAEECLIKGIDLSARINLHALGANAHQCLGYIYTHTGDFQKAVENFGKALDLRGESRLFVTTGALTSISSSLAKLLSGDRGIDLQMLYKCFYNNRVKLHVGTMARGLGQIQLNSHEPDLDQAQLWLDRAVSEHEKYGMHWELGRDYEARGEYFKKIGEINSAKESLRRSEAIFDKCGADGWARETARIQAEL